MDTIKYLLFATIALLLGALAVSWQGMNTAVKNVSPDEIARLEKQVKELRAESDKLGLERQMQQLNKSTPSEIPSAAASAAEMDAMKRQVEANKQALADLDDQAKAARDKQLSVDEDGLIAQKGLESKDGELRRARLIGDALLMGRISEYVEDPKLGGFITFNILMPEQVQKGTILAIRRKTGILGQLKVSDISADGAIANPLPGFGPVKPKPGDELILPPL